MLLDVHRAQDSGLDLTDIAKRSGKMVIAEDRRRARSRMHIVGLFELGHAFVVLLHGPTKIGGDLLRSRGAGREFIDIDGRTGTGAFGNNRYGTRVTRTGLVKIVTRQLLFVGDILR